MHLQYLGHFQWQAVIKRGENRCYNVGGTFIRAFRTKGLENATSEDVRGGRTISLMKMGQQYLASQGNYEETGDQVDVKSTLKRFAYCTGLRFRKD